MGLSPAPLLRQVIRLLLLILWPIKSSLIPGFTHQMGTEKAYSEGVSSDLRLSCAYYDNNILLPNKMPAVLQSYSMHFPPSSDVYIPEMVGV